MCALGARMDLIYRQVLDTYGNGIYFTDDLAHDVLKRMV